MPGPSDIDGRYLEAAIRLGRRNLGRAFPNPAVGCLIVADGAGGRRIVGRGVTAPSGRPHAETQALAEAGPLARGATAYVSLEPCAHHGRTPPCALALAEAGVARVVYPFDDPDARVSGNGRTMLEAAGIEVVTGLAVESALEANAGHVLRIARGRPLVTLKLAVGADGFIAAAGRKPVAITGEAARAHAHMLRAIHDGILVGAGTVRADDPLLTCRLPGMAAWSPVRIVLDGSGSVPASARMLADASAPVWLLGPGRTGLPGHVRSLRVERHGGMAAMLTLLAGEGITRLLVEGGAEVAAQLLDSGLADEIAIYRGAAEAGAGGLLPFGDRGLAALEAHEAYSLVETAQLGADRMLRFRRSGFPADLQACLPASSATSGSSAP
ncbi:MAG: bifunctional diaminohydroxyphosphoribosylaminopyrimidine deaminase/5-amino-6-(5-phosphoribosylamino)uracil reductase RibD [Flavobacteriaceae bacterium]